MQRLLLLWVLLLWLVLLTAWPTATPLAQLPHLCPC
jgi:hypothetical protein